MKLKHPQMVLHPLLLGVFFALADAKGTFYGSPYRYNLYTSGSSPHYNPGKPMSRHKNFCAYVVQKNVSCTMQDGTSTYVKAEYNKCTWGQKCPTVMYRTFYKPKYKVGYKTVTELEWRCCPGFSGEGCSDGPTSLPDLMPQFKGSMTPPGFKGPFPIGQPEQHKPFPIGHPEQKSIPGGHMSPGQKKSYYARKFQEVLGERLDHVEEELRRLSQSYESLNGMVTGLEDSLRLSLREDTNKMLGSLLGTPPRGSDSSVGFGVIPDGTPEGLEGGEGFLGFGELAGKVTEVKDELKTKSQMLDELQGMVVSHDGQLKHLIEAAAGRPSPITSQTLLEELVDTKLAGVRSEILDGFEARLSGLESQCEARIGEVQRQCQQEHLNGQHHMEQSLDGRETGLRKELGNLQAQIQGLTLTESCCTQVSSLSQRVLLLEEGLKSLDESQRVQQSSIVGQAAQVETFFDGRLDEIEARLNATEKADTEKMKGYVASEVDGFKTLLDEKLRMLEERLFVAVEELGNTTAPAGLEGQAVPALETELEALKKQAEGGLEGVQSRLTDLETLCSSACPHAAGEVQKLHREMEECCETDKKVSGQLDSHADLLRRLNGTLQEILARLAQEEEGSVQGEITLLKINVSTVNRSLKGLQESISVYAQEVSHANSTWQQHELKMADQVQGIQQLVGRQGSQLGFSERRLQQLKGELQSLKHRLTGELKGCKSAALGAQQEITQVDGRISQVEGLCGSLGDLAGDLERIRGELESHSNDYLAQVNGTLSTHSQQIAELKGGLKDCLDKTGDAEKRGDP
ncbi:EMIL3 protein, partial [Polyodon spathula]|nr:EMIL3 protein [Polyodon spathula]